MKRVGVNACTGRMGQEILVAVDQDSACELSAALLRKGHAWVGSQIQHQFAHIKSQVILSDNIQNEASHMDVLIDFSLPDFSLNTAQQCAEAGLPVVIGTTGFSAEQIQALQSLGDTIPVLMAPNMSVGVNLSLKLLEMVAKVIGEESDIEILEAHHRYKKDAPSGTALRMGESIAQGLGKSLQDIAVYDRAGHDQVRQPGSLGFASLRAGHIIGEHSALFAMAGEQIEIKHSALSRQTFAQGAVRAAKWLVQQEPGCYDMMDVLAIK